MKRQPINKIYCQELLKNLAELGEETRPDIREKKYNELLQKLGVKNDRRNP